MHIEEQLQNLANDDTIHEADVWDMMTNYMTMRERKKYLDNHPYKITQTADGRWFTRFPQKPTGSKVQAFSSKEALENAIVKYYQEDESNPTIQSLFNVVIAERLDEGSITPATATRSRNDFNRYYKEFGQYRIQSVTADILEQFIREQKKIYHLNAKAYNNLTCLTRMIFKYARKKRFTDLRINDVLEDIDWGKNAFRQEEKDDSEDVFTDEEVRLLARYMKERLDRRHLGLLLCFSTGLRIGELSALTWLDIKDEEIFVHRTETRWVDEDGHTQVDIRNLPKTKAGKRIVPIPSYGKWLIQSLRDLNPDGEYVFMLNGKRTQAEAFRKALYKACEAVGIPKRSPHKLRKTYASILLDNGVTNKFITEVMGHTDINTTNSSYARRRKSTEQRLKIINAIPEFQMVAETAQKQAF